MERFPGTQQRRRRMRQVASRAKLPAHLLQDEQAAVDGDGLLHARACGEGQGERKALAEAEQGLKTA
jgi:hypothetical protein